MAAWGEDISVLVDIFEANTDAGADAAFLHRDAVEAIGGGHGFLGVGDDDEAGGGEELFEHVDEAANIRFVERGIDFVEHAERARPVLENGHNERDGGERFFAAAEERVGEGGFSGWGGDNLDARLFTVGPWLEHQVGVTAAERFAVKQLEVLTNDFECFQEHSLAVLIDLADQFQQPVLRLDEVAVLAVERIEARLERIEFLQRLHVYRADRLNFLTQAAESVLGGLGLIEDREVALQLGVAQIDVVFSEHSLLESFELLLELLEVESGLFMLAFSIA